MYFKTHVFVKQSMMTLYFTMYILTRIHCSFKTVNLGVMRLRVTFCCCCYFLDLFYSLVDNEELAYSKVAFPLALSVISPIFWWIESGDWRLGSVGHQLIGHITGQEIEGGHTGSVRAVL